MEVVNASKGVPTNAISGPNILSRTWGGAERQKQKVVVVVAAGVLATGCASNEQDPATAMDGDINGAPVEASQNPEPTQMPETDQKDSETNEGNPPTTIPFESIYAEPPAPEVNCWGVEVSEDEEGNILFKPLNRSDEIKSAIIQQGFLADSPPDSDIITSGWHHQQLGDKAVFPAENVEAMKEHVENGGRGFLDVFASPQELPAENVAYETDDLNQGELLQSVIASEGYSCAQYQIVPGKNGEVTTEIIVPSSSSDVDNAPTTDVESEAPDTNMDDQEPNFSEEDKAAFPFLPHLKEFNSDSFEFEPKIQEDGQLEVCIKIDAPEGSDEFYRLDAEARDAFYSGIEEIEKATGNDLTDAVMHGTDLKAVAGDNC